ncbi:MAG: glycosyltransferase [Xenococcaceae cyanobacterium MO_167.B27]|nr:glycosyltransferase [Xenococcaceae cyanobacterium MO_167.B27]
MRILLTADPELPVPPKLYGGIERIIDLLITGLKSRGHKIGLVAHKDSTTKCDCLFPWRGARSQDKIDMISNTYTLWQAIREFQPDLVHSYSRLFYLFPWLLNSSLPKVMSYQRQPSSRTTAWGSKLGKKSLTFTGCSEYICRQGRKVAGTWYPIHNCVELDKYTFQPTVASDAPLVFLSRIERIKGAHTAIEVAKKTGRRLLIAGNYSTVGEAGKYWEEAILPHLDKNGIEYVGTVDDVQKNQLLGQAAAMIVPIEWEEPFGIVFAEALACGTPVISCPRGALPEIVRQGIDGYLVSNIKEACDRVTHLDRINRNNCRQRVEEYFSASVIVDKYEKLYTKLLRNNYSPIDSESIAA